MAGSSEPSLKRLLDYKLLFDCLADERNGKISVLGLSVRWPKGSEVKGTKFPSGCIEDWKAVADKDGYLDWDAFSSGLIKALQTDAALQKERSEESTSKKPDSGKHNSVGKSLLTNPVKSSEIEEFLSDCDRKNLVKALARMKKEVYSCQSTLHQQQLQEEATPKNNGTESNIKPKTKNDKDVSSENSASGKTEFKEDIGNEKEELLKGIEVLQQTQQWFSSRLEQLEAEGSRNRKPSVEELLAIMEGSSVHPAAQTLHHIQKINAHLSSLALHAPMMASSNKPRKTSVDSRADHKIQRMISEPGPAAMSSRPRRTHRASATSPAHSLHPPVSESGARVIGIDIPTSSMNQLRPEGFGGTAPRRSLSFQEIRAAHPSQERLKQTSKRAISSPDKQESDKRSKPRRSLSFNSNSVQSEEPDMARAGTHMNYSTSLPQTQGYPLRETMSLNQLPNAGVSHRYSSYSSASQRLGHGGQEDSHQGNAVPMRSSSMMTLPSREASNKEQKPQKKFSRSHQKKLEKEELRARQVAAQQYVLNTEAYQRPHLKTQVTSSHSMV